MCARAASYTVHYTMHESVLQRIVFLLLYNARWSSPLLFYKAADPKVGSTAEQLKQAAGQERDQEQEK